MLPWLCSGGRTHPMRSANHDGHRATLNGTISRAYDAEPGESKSLTLMSRRRGGLTKRSCARFLLVSFAQNFGRKYAPL
jgi:hypothetical protein